MAYSGNIIHSSVSCNIATLRYINNKAYPEIANSMIYFDSYSPDYSSRSTTACMNYNLISSGKILVVIIMCIHSEYNYLTGL